MSRYSSGKQIGFYQNQETTKQATGQAKELVNRIATEIAVNLTKKVKEPLFRIDITKKQKNFLMSYGITKRFLSMKDFYFDFLLTEQFSKNGKIRYTIADNSFVMKLGSSKTVTVFKKGGKRETIYRESDLIIKFEIQRTQTISERTKNLVSKYL